MIISYSEFQYRRGEKELERCRRIAQGMIDRERSALKREVVKLALEGWLEAGNGRKQTDGPEAA